MARDSSMKCWIGPLTMWKKLLLKASTGATLLTTTEYHWGISWDVTTAWVSQQQCQTNTNLHMRWKGSMSQKEESYRNLQSFHHRTSGALASFLHIQGHVLSLHGQTHTCSSNCCLNSMSIGFHILFLNLDKVSECSSFTNQSRHTISQVRGSFKTCKA